MSDHVFVEGDKVIVANDPIHVGTVEKPDSSLVYVRWHRGYATWQSVADLRLAPSAT